MSSLDTETITLIAYNEKRRADFSQADQQSTFPKKSIINRHFLVRLSILFLTTQVLLIPAEAIGSDFIFDTQSKKELESRNSKSQEILNEFSNQIFAKIEQIFQIHRAEYRFLDDDPTIFSITDMVYHLEAKFPGVCGFLDEGERKHFLEFPTTLRMTSEDYSYFMQIHIAHGCDVRVFYSPKEEKVLFIRRSPSELGRNLHEFGKIYFLEIPEIVSNDLFTEQALDAAIRFNW